VAKQSVANFDGYNSSKNPIATPMNFLRAAKNCVLENGQIRKRKKFCKLFTQTPMSGATEYLIQEIFGYITSAGALYLLFRHNGTWKYSTQLDLATAVSLEADPQTYYPVSFKFSNYPNILYVTTGGFTSGRKFYGGSGLFHPIGLPTPVADFSSVTFDTAGVNFPAAGTYLYTYSWLETDTGVETESNAWPTNTTRSPNGSQTVVFTIPARPESRISKARIYRSLAGGSILYRLTDVIVSGSPTVFTDNGTYTPNQLVYTKPIDRFTQPAFVPKHIEWHKSRMFYTEQSSNKLWWSEANEPESVNSTSYLQVGNANDPFKFIFSRPQFLLIIKHHSVWILEGSGPSDFQLQKVFAENFEFERAIMWHEGWLYYVNESGIWRSNLFDTAENIGFQIWEDIKESLIIGSSSSNIDVFNIAYDPTHKHLWFILPYISGASTLRNCFVYDPKLNRWLGSIYSLVSSAVKSIRINSILNLLAAINENGLVFYNPPESNILTDEISFDFMVQLGGMINPELINIEKNFRFCNVTLQLTSGDEENVGAKFKKADGLSSGIVTRQFVNNKVVTYPVQRASTGLSVEFNQPGVDPNKDWAIVGVGLDFEPIGIW
jgi:hypothetical protein